MPPETRVVHCRRERSDVYVGRPGAFGNPFPVTEERTRSAAIEQFSSWIAHQPDLLWLVRKRLPGQALGCWCAPEACHGDILKAIADGTSPIEIPREPIFVFGSNQAGRHGRGAAKAAQLIHGAEAGVGEGLTGQAYAIPSKDEQLRPISLSGVFRALDRFFGFAASDGAGWTFRMTRVGCGLAGLPETAIMNFCRQHAGPNIELPGLWRPEGRDATPRVIVAGSRTFDDRERAFRALHQVQEKLGHFEVVSGGARGADALGEEFAVTTGLPLRRFPADWEGLGRAAGYYRNATMAWYSTHLLAFHQGNSPGTAHMIDLAREAGLTVAVIRA